MTESVTSLSLLCALQQPEHHEESWRRLVERYGSKIYSWCIHRGLQATDADDVTQMVLIKLAAKMREFEYDPGQSFRGWLRRVTENTIVDFLRSLRSREVPDGGSNIWALLSQAEATEELSQQLKDRFDLELLELAMSRVQSRVNENRWRAWYLCAKGGWPGAEVAAELGMKVATVYTARNQVENLLREEIRTLEGDS